MSRALKIAVVMDPIAQINYKKDSTLAMLWAAQKRGHELWYIEPQHLRIENGEAVADMAALRVYEDAHKWFDLDAVQTRALREMDVVLMRKDPPFDMNFIYATYILERAEAAGVLIVNKPQSLRDCNEKIFATFFPELMAPTLISSQKNILRNFIAEHKKVILKPLDGMGGTGVFLVEHNGPNIGSTIETLTQNEQSPIMAQRYIPEIVDGDKRILMIDGEPVPYCLARIPQGDEVRGNLAAGGRGEARPLTEADYAIAKKVGPELKKRGLLFVGLDVIGSYLTEVNVTSPTCIREIDAAFSTNIADQLLQCIEAKVHCH